MTTVSLKLDRWRTLLKAMDEVRPGLRGDEATWCDKFRSYMEKTLFNQMGTEPFAIDQPQDAWARVCGFCERHAIPYKRILEQLTGKPHKPAETVVEPDELDECRKMLAMTDDEFERATKPQPEPEKVEQPTLFD